MVAAGLSLVAVGRGSSLRSWASRSGCSSGTQALGAWASAVPAQGPRSCGARALVAPQNLESSWTRDRTLVLCIGRQILVPCTPREAPKAVVLNSNFTLHSPKVLHKNRDEYEPPSHSDSDSVGLGMGEGRGNGDSLGPSGPAWILQLLSFIQPALSGFCHCLPPGEAIFPFSPWLLHLSQFLVKKGNAMRSLRTCFQILLSTVKSVCCIILTLNRRCLLRSQFGFEKVL